VLAGCGKLLKINQLQTEEIEDNIEVDRQEIGCSYVTEDCVQ
jgi:hypothetical protein